MRGNNMRRNNMSEKYSYKRKNNNRNRRKRNNRRRTIRRIKMCVSLLVVLGIIIFIIFSIGFMIRGCFANDTVDVDLNPNLEAANIYGNTKEDLQRFAEEKGLSLNEWPDRVLEMMEKNPETKDFVFNYPLLKDSNPTIDISDSLNSDSVPLFMQWDQRWGYTHYGDDIIAISGCGPTCLSMVASYLLKDPSLDPKTLAEFSEANGYCAPSNGSYWTLISEGGEKLGLNVKELPLDESYIKSSLEEGKPVICIMGPGDFTTGGHYIVLTDYVNGKIKINDPNSNANSEKLWDYSKIEKQIENLWSCSGY